MKVQNYVKLIKADLLRPHPDNPRKNLGDLSELSDSIKKNGILQNLTVVPDSDVPEGEGYLIVIGHRRHAAGIQAGLEEFPCIVKELSHAEQVKIMLCENIQRNDLTVLEQAQGFQMMIDFGITVEELARDTGFSQSTIYHRLNIAKLNQNNLEKKLDQLTLTDLIELEKIDSITERNKLLKDANLRFDFRKAVRNSYESQEKKKISKKLQKKCKAAGLIEKKANSWDSNIGEYDSFYIKIDTDPDKVKFTKKGVQFTHYYISEYGNVLLYVPAKKEKKKKSEQEKALAAIEKKIRECYAEINTEAHQITEQIDLFLREAAIHDKGFDPDIVADFTAETLLFLMTDTPTLWNIPKIQRRTEGVKDIWRYDRDDQERYAKHGADKRKAILEDMPASPIRCAGILLAGLAEEITDNGKITQTCEHVYWKDGEILRLERVYMLSRIIEIVSKLGFELDEEGEQLLQGKGSAFDKIATFAEEYRDTLQKEKQ